MKKPAFFCLRNEFSTYEINENECTHIFKATTIPKTQDNEVSFAH